MNAHGMLTGILNPLTESAPDPNRRSRGELCVDCLRQPSLESAARGVCGHAGNAYNPFHLLLATAEGAVVLGNAAPAIARRDLAPGVHVLTNLDLDDPRCPRRAKAHALFEAAAAPLRDADLGGFLESAAAALADHSAPLDSTPGAIPNNLCVHGDAYGTRSSTVIVFDAEIDRFRYWHADGAPCRREHREYDLPYEA